MTSEAFETIAHPVRLQCTLKMQASCPSRFARITLLVSPSEENHFSASTVDQSGDQHPYLLPFLRTGWELQCAEGCFAGHPVRQVAVCVEALWWHMVDSRPRHFQQVMQVGLQAAMREAPMLIQSDGTRTKAQVTPMKLPRWFSVRNVEHL